MKATAKPAMTIPLRFTTLTPARRFTSYKRSVGLVSTRLQQHGDRPTGLTTGSYPQQQYRCLSSSTSGKDEPDLTPSDGVSLGSPPATTTHDSSQDRSKSQSSAEDQKTHAAEQLSAGSMGTKQGDKHEQVQQAKEQQNESGVDTAKSKDTNSSSITPGSTEAQAVAIAVAVAQALNQQQQSGSSSAAPPPQPTPAPNNDSKSSDSKPRAPASIDKDGAAEEKKRKEKEAAERAAQPAPPTQNAAYREISSNPLTAGGITAEPTSRQRAAIEVGDTGSLSVTGLDESKKSAQVRGILWFDNIMPTRAAMVDFRYLLVSHSHETLIPRIFKTACPDVEILEMIPRIKEGGVFVRFKTKNVDKYSSPESVADAIIDELKRNKHRAFLTQVPVQCHLVYGSPFLEDLLRVYPANRVRIEIRGDLKLLADVTVEQLYEELRPFGVISDMSLGPTPEKANQPRIATAQFNKMYSAIGARNCLHRYKLPIGGSPPADKSNTDNQPGVNLFLYYESLLKTSTISDFVNKHTRIMIPLIAALFALTTWLIFDPIREFNVVSHITKRFSLKHLSGGYSNSITAWAKNQWRSLRQSRFLSNIGIVANNESANIEVVWSGRKMDEDRVIKWMRSVPDRILFLTGPKGAGKAALVDKVVKDKDNVVMIDFGKFLNDGNDDNVIKGLSQALGFKPGFAFLTLMSQLADIITPGASKATGQQSQFSTQAAKILEVTTGALMEIAKKRGTPSSAVISNKHTSTNSANDVAEKAANTAAQRPGRKTDQQEQPSGSAGRDGPDGLAKAGQDGGVPKPTSASVGVDIKVDDTDAGGSNDTGIISDVSKAASSAVSSVGTAVSALNPFADKSKREEPPQQSGTPAERQMQPSNPLPSTANQADTSDDHTDRVPHHGALSERAQEREPRSPSPVIVEPSWFQRVMGAVGLSEVIDHDGRPQDYQPRPDTRQGSSPVATSQQQQPSADPNSEDDDDHEDDLPPNDSIPLFIIDGLNVDNREKHQSFAVTFTGWAAEMEKLGFARFLYLADSSFEEAIGKALPDAKLTEVMLADASKDNAVEFVQKSLRKIRAAEHEREEKEKSRAQRRREQEEEREADTGGLVGDKQKQAAAQHDSKQQPSSTPIHQHSTSLTARSLPVAPAAASKTPGAPPQQQPPAHADDTAPPPESEEARQNAAELAEIRASIDIVGGRYNDLQTLVRGLESGSSPAEVVEEMVTAGMNTTRSVLFSDDKAKMKWTQNQLWLTILKLSETSKSYLLYDDLLFNVFKGDDAALRGLVRQDLLRIEQMPQGRDRVRAGSGVVMEAFRRLAKAEKLRPGLDLAVAKQMISDEQKKIDAQEDELRKLAGIMHDELELRRYLQMDEDASGLSNDNHSLTATAVSIAKRRAFLLQQLDESVDKQRDWWTKQKAAEKAVKASKPSEGEKDKKQAAK